MKKTLLTLAMFISVSVALHAQRADSAAATGAVPQQKPKTALEQSKQNNGTTAGTADTSRVSQAAQKKPVKKSCCKKHGEGMPCSDQPANKPKTPAIKPE